MPESILVVDDEDIVRDLVENFLRAHGHDVVTANNVESALAVFTEKQNDIFLVLTDLCMPIINDGLRLRRSIEKISDLPVVLMSGSYSKIPEHSELHGAFSGFLGKPLDLKLLITTVKSFASC